MMQPRGHATHMQRHQFSKSQVNQVLIGVWHKDNLYLGTGTIETDAPTQRILFREREV